MSAPDTSGAGGQPELTDGPPVDNRRHALAYDATSLTFAYDGAPLLDNLSLALPAGAFGALLGPNGSGKSTLLKLLLGRLQPSAGSIRLFGEPLAQIRADERARQVGYLPQEVRAVYPFTVEEVVLMGRGPHLGLRLETTRDRDIAARCLERTSTSHLTRRLFGTLSGGERQRVLLASVLAQEPRVLLLDEPTAALDLHHQHEVMELLAGLQAEGLAICLVTHDLNLAARWCPQLWLLDRGRIRAHGTPAEVLTAETLASVYGDRLRVVADPDLGGPLVLSPLPEARP